MISLGPAGYALCRRDRGRRRALRRRAVARRTGGGPARWPSARPAAPWPCGAERPTPTCETSPGPRRPRPPGSRRTGSALEEARAEALFDLGSAGRGAGRATAALVAEHPFRERLWSLLALALYRCDRQADALETLRTLRPALVEELGVDPSPVGARPRADGSAGPGPAPRRAGGSRPGHPARPRPSTRPAPGSRVWSAGRRCWSAIDDALDRPASTTALGGVAAAQRRGGDRQVACSPTEVVHRARRRGAAGRRRALPRGRPGAAVLALAAGPARPRGPATPCRRGGGAARGTSRHPTARGGDARRRRAAHLRRGDAAARGARPSRWSWCSRTCTGPTRLLRLLAYAAEALRDRPVLFVVTVRATSTRGHPALAPALAGLARLGATRLRVPRLGVEAVAELLRDVFADPDPALAEVLAAAHRRQPVLRAGDGATARRGRQGDGHGTAGTARGAGRPVRRARRHRRRAPAPVLAGCGEPAREALGVASVVGRRFDARVARRPLLERSPLDDLDAAVAAGVVEDERRAGTLPVRARAHARDRRTATCGRAGGRTLARPGRPDPGASGLPRQPELVAEVAHHLAARGGVPPRDGARAAVRLRRRGRPRGRAPRRLRRGLPRWSGNAGGRGPGRRARPARRHELLLGLATARSGSATCTARRARSTRRSRWPGGAATTCGWREAATSFRCSGVWHWREMGDADEATIAVIEECLDARRRHRCCGRGCSRRSGWSSTSPGRTRGADRAGREVAASWPAAQRRSRRAPDCLGCAAVALCPARHVPANWWPWPAESLALAPRPEHEIVGALPPGERAAPPGPGAEADAVMAGAFAIADAAAAHRARRPAGLVAVAARRRARRPRTPTDLGQRASPCTAVPPWSAWRSSPASTTLE